MSDRAQLGAKLMAPAWLSVAGVAAPVAGCQVQVRLVEEACLAHVHGHPNAARTGRLLPGIGRLSPQPTGPAADAGRRLIGPT